MIDRRIALLPLLALAGTSLSGCVAVAIPAIAGAGIFGTQVAGDAPVEDVARAAPAVAPGPATAPAASAPAIAAASVAPATAPQQSVAQAQTAAVAAATLPTAASPLTTTTPAPAIDAPSAPRGENDNFARFVRYGRGMAAVSAQTSGPLSAMLADPVALDGIRKRCGAGEQPVAIIDLDPADGAFTPPADPQEKAGLTLGLAVLREAGVQIAWISDLPVSRIGAVRTALEKGGLDPRGEDIVSLSRDPDDRKQARKESLASQSCIIAIAGDEKADFDERFRYLKNPEAGEALEAAINDGWFLIEPIFPAAQ